MFNYSDRILDHFYHPRNVGVFSKEETVIEYTKATPDKSAVMQLQTKVQNGVITAVKFKTFGCPCCIAVTSVITTWLENKAIHELSDISAEKIIRYLDLPKEKYYCALLGEDLVKDIML